MLKHKKLERKWLAALRSPNNQSRKCRGVIRTDDGMVCALGLLQEISGSSDLFSLFRTPSDCYYITALNDGNPTRTFAEIADRIEERERC